MANKRFQLLYEAVATNRFGNNLYMILRFLFLCLKESIKFVFKYTS